MKISIFGIFLLVNAVAILCALNPWWPNWQRQGITLLVVEVVVLVFAGVPAVIYQVAYKNKTFRQSLSDTIDAVIDFLASVV